MPYLTKTQKVIFSSIFGTLAYGLVMVDLSIKALKVTESGVNSTNNRNPTSICSVNHSTKIAGWTLGLIAIAPTTGFASLNIYKVLTNRRDNSYYAIVLVLFLCCGIPSGLLNSKNSYKASKDILYNCDNTNNISRFVTLILLSIISMLAPAIANSTAFYEFIHEEVEDFWSISGRFFSSKNNNELNKHHIRIKCRYTPLPKLKLITSLNDTTLNKKDLCYLIVDKACIFGCLIFNFKYACKSYDEYAGTFSLYLLQCINTQANFNQPISKIIGKISWVFNSLTTGLLFNRVLFKPVVPDILSTSNGYATIFSVLLLSLITAFPNFYIPLVEKNIEVGRKLIDATSMVVSSFIFAAAGLMDVIEKVISQYYEIPYTSRQDLTQRVIVNTTNQYDENNYQHIEDLQVNHL